MKLPMSFDYVGGSLRFPPGQRAAWEKQEVDPREVPADSFWSGRLSQADNDGVAPPLERRPVETILSDLTARGVSVRVDGDVVEVSGSARDVDLFAGLELTRVFESAKQLGASGRLLLVGGMSGTSDDVYSAQVIVKDGRATSQTLDHAAALELQDTPSEQALPTSTVVIGTNKLAAAEVKKLGEEYGATKASLKKLGVAGRIFESWESGGRAIGSIGGNIDDGDRLIFLDDSGAPKDIEGLPKLAKGSFRTRLVLSADGNTLWLAGNAYQDAGVYEVRFPEGKARQIWKTSADISSLGALPDGGLVARTENGLELIRNQGGEWKSVAALAGFENRYMRVAFGGKLAALWKVGPQNAHVVGIHGDALRLLTDPNKPLGDAENVEVLKDKLYLVKGSTTRELTGVAEAYHAAFGVAL